MNQRDERGSGQVAVKCPHCEARLRPRTKDTSYRVKCPHCSGAVSVPSRNEVLRRRRQQPGDGSQDAPVKAAKRKPKVEHAAICPNCNTDFVFTLDDGESTTECPLCGCELEFEIPGQPASKVPPAPAEPAPDSMKVERRKRKKKRKRPGFASTFISGVFTFPWRLSILSRWILISIGWTVVGILSELIYWLVSSGGGFAYVAFGCFVLPHMFISSWVSSYSAACCFPVLTETAAGNDEIYGWPEPVLREWALPAFYTAYIASVAGTLGYGVGLMFGNWTDSSTLALLVTMFVVFPIFLLSTFEANTIWAPLTLPTLRTLISLWWGWLFFYLSTGLLWAGWGIMVVSGIKAFPFFSWTLTGPLLAAILLIYSRLLGRLAWRAEQDG